MSEADAEDARPPILTRRQKDIVDFMRAFIGRRGIAPTLEEIGGYLGTHKVTVFGHVEELIRKGVLVRQARRSSRSLTFAPPRPARPIEADALRTHLRHALVCAAHPSECEACADAARAVGIPIEVSA